MQKARRKWLQIVISSKGIVTILSEEPVKLELPGIKIICKKEYPLCG